MVPGLKKREKTFLTIVNTQRTKKMEKTKQSRTPFGVKWQGKQIVGIIIILGQHLELNKEMHFGFSFKARACLEKPIIRSE